MRQFWSWWKEDWRGKNGQRPTINQLMAEIGRFKVGELEPVVSTVVEWTYGKMQDLSKVEY